MSGIVNQTGARSGVIGTTVGTPTSNNLVMSTSGTTVATGGAEFTAPNPVCFQTASYLAVGFPNDLTAILNPHLKYYICVAIDYKVNH